MSFILDVLLILEDIRCLYLIPQVVNEMRVTVVFGQVKRRLTFFGLAVNTYLLGQEVEEDVHVTTNCRMVDVRVVMVVLLVAVGSELHQGLDAVVCAVLDCQRHQGVTVAFELITKDVESCVPLVAVEMTQNLDVILDNCIVDWQELPYLKFILINLALYLHLLL